MRALFYLESRPAWPRRPTGCIAKVLTDVQENFWHFERRKSDCQQRWWAISTWYSENRGYVHFKACLTLKIVQRCIFGILDVKNPDHQKRRLAMHTIIGKIGVMLTSGLVWPWKSAGMSARANRQHSKDLNGLPRDISAFWTSEIRITNKDGKV